MIRSARTLAVAAASAVALAACSGGGSTTQTAPVVPGSTASSDSRAQASITVHYTANVHRLTHTSSAKRSPRFVDPFGTTLTVSSVTQPSNVQIASITFHVAPGPDGSQTLTVPITSSADPGSTTFINVTESDPDAGTLAAGQGSLSGVQPGTFVAGPAITLYMKAAGVLATTNIASGSDATLLSYDANAPTDLFNDVTLSFNACAAESSSGFALLPFDALFDYASLFGRPAGLGGIPPVQVLDQQTDNGGTSRLASDSSGLFHIVFDAAHHAVSAHLGVYDLSPAGAPGNLTTQTYIRLVYRNCST